MKKTFFYSSFFLLFFTTYASDAMLVELPPRPKTVIDRIAPEFYRIKIYDPRYSLPSLTALLYNGHTNYPFLFLVPNNYNRKVYYLPYVLNAIPTVQIEATGTHFSYRVTHLAVHKHDKKPVSKVIGIEPSTEKSDLFVLFTIPKKSFPFAGLNCKVDPEFFEPETENIQ